MSKDKGSKNKKKAPANKSDKSDGKVKPPSSYKMESKNGQGTPPALNVISVKPAIKPGDVRKP